MAVPPEQIDPVGLHFVTPADALDAFRAQSAGVNLAERHQLIRFADVATRTPRQGFAHFLSPQLHTLVKEKPRIAVAEKAEFAELLSENPSGRPIQELPVELLRRSFMIRKKVVAEAAGEESEAASSSAPAVPPDIPPSEQTTNKLSAAFMKKVLDSWVCGPMNAHVTRGLVLHIEIYRA